MTGASPRRALALLLTLPLPLLFIRDSAHAAWPPPAGSLIVHTGLSGPGFDVAQAVAYIHFQSNGQRRKPSLVRQMISSIARYASHEDHTLSQNAQQLLGALGQPRHSLTADLASKEGADRIHSPPQPSVVTTPDAPRARQAGPAPALGYLGRELGLDQKAFALPQAMDYVLRARTGSPQRTSLIRHMVVILACYVSLGDDTTVTNNATSLLQALDRSLPPTFDRSCFALPPRPEAEPAPEPYIGPREERFCRAAALAKQPSRSFLEGAPIVAFHRGTADWHENAPNKKNAEQSRAVAFWHYRGRKWVVKFTPFLPPDKLRRERQVQAVMNQLGHGPRLAPFVVMHPEYGYGIAMELLPDDGVAWYSTSVTLPRSVSCLAGAHREGMADQLARLQEDLRMLATEGVAIQVGDPQFWLSPRTRTAAIFDFGEWSLAGPPRLEEKTLSRMAKALRH